MNPLRIICSECDADGSQIRDAEARGLAVTHGLCEEHAAQWRQELEDGDRQRRRDLWGARRVPERSAMRVVR